MFKRRNIILKDGDLGYLQLWIGMEAASLMLGGLRINKFWFMTIETRWIIGIFTILFWFFICYKMSGIKEIKE